MSSELPTHQEIDPRTLKVPSPRKVESSTEAPDSNIVKPSVSVSPTSTVVGTLDRVQPIDPGSFPHPPRSTGGYVPTTIENVAHLLEEYGITVGYDVIRKRLCVRLPHRSGTSDNEDNLALTHIQSLATLNAMGCGQIPAILAALGDLNPLNPVADWINSKRWDGVDRLDALADTLVHRDDFPVPLKRQLLHRWLISAVAAALRPNGFHSRGILTLQGPQSIGKTSWIRSLVSDASLCARTVKLDHHLDASNKDSLLTALSHWIVEIGELDSSLKKDVARLKGFITSDRDKLRRPYARSDSEYPRRTVFCATVNDHAFLVDSTGNSRFWTIPVVRVIHNHGIEMQQLFAQVASDYHAGEQWWLTQDEENLLEKFNKDHRVVSVIRERILATLDMGRAKEANLPAKSAIEMLEHAGVDRPTNPQCKECTALLRELLGEPKKNRGIYKWRVPLASHGRGRLPPGSPLADDNDDDRY